MMWSHPLLLSDVTEDPGMPLKSSAIFYCQEASQGSFETSDHPPLVKHVLASQCHILQRVTRNATVTSHVQNIQNCFWPIFTYFRQDNFL